MSFCSDEVDELKPVMHSTPLHTSLSEDMMDTAWDLYCAIFLGAGMPDEAFGFKFDIFEANPNL